MVFHLPIMQLLQITADIINVVGNFEPLNDHRPDSSADTTAYAVSLLMAFGRGQRMSSLDERYMEWRGGLLSKRSRRYAQDTFHEVWKSPLGTHT